MSQKKRLPYANTNLITESGELMLDAQRSLDVLASPEQMSADRRMALAVLVQLKIEKALRKLSDAGARIRY